MIGPCLCGDPYCPSCGDPSLAAKEAAMDKLCEIADDWDEYDFQIAMTVLPILIKSFRETTKNLNSEIRADYQMTIDQLRDKLLMKKEGLE